MANNELTYKVTVAGTCFCVDPASGTKTTKPYMVEIILDKTIVDEMGPLSPFCKFWAPENMPLVVPGYRGLETHQVMSCESNTGSTIKDIRLMNVFDMESYIESRELPIELELYRDDAERLRQAITECEQDPTAFAKQQNRLMTLYGKSISLKNRLKSLNAPVISQQQEVATFKQEAPVAAATTVAEARPKGKTRTALPELGI